MHMRIPLKEVSVNVEISGEGQPLVFLHGNGESGKLFKDMPALFGTGYKVVLPDTRGHGKSSYAPLGYDYFAEDLKGIIEHLGITGASVVGFSDGAITALKAMVKYPGLIGKAVLSGGNLSPEGLKPSSLKLFKLGYRITHSEFLNLMITEPRFEPDELKKIDIPVLILVGERDLVTREDALLQHSLIPNSRLEILPGESHVGYVKDNRKLYSLIKDFI